jgi:hypothetical protein
MGLRAYKLADKVVIDYSITLDGVLLDPIVPTFQVIRRSDQVIVGSGSLAQDAGPGMFHGEKSGISEGGRLLRVKVNFTFLGIGIDDEADISEINLEDVEITAISEPISILVGDIAAVSLVESAVSILDATDIFSVAALSEVVGVSL